MRFTRALESEGPSPVVLSFFYLSMVHWLMDGLDQTAAQQKLKDERWGLMPYFLIGMLEGASSRSCFVGGNEYSYYYKSSEELLRAYHTTRGRALNFVPPALREKYSRQVQVGQALYTTDEYVWCYSERGIHW